MSSSIAAPSREYVAPPTAQAYLEIYRGTPLILKVGGDALTLEKLPALVEQILFLTKEGISFILIFGGGPQIDREWSRRHPGQPREKVNEVGITDEHVLDDGVLPAYWKLRRKIQELLPNFHIIDPRNISCEPVPDAGLVGEPISLALPPNRNIAIGFVGNIDRQPVNMNGDAVTRVVAGLSRGGNLFLVTEAGGVRDPTTGEIVSLIPIDEIGPDGSHPSIAITGGMLQKMQEIRQVLLAPGSNTHQARMVGEDQVVAEITEWRGRGTLVFDPRYLQCGRANQHEIEIFRVVREELTTQGRFRSRSAEEWKPIEDAHFVVRVDQTPLGGFSLLEHGDFVEFCAFWSCYPKNGIGREIVAKAKQQFQQMEGQWLYALSIPTTADIEHEKKLVALYEGYGFRSLGPLREAQRTDPGFPPHLERYDHSNRNPFLFVRPREAAEVSTTPTDHRSLITDH